MNQKPNPHSLNGGESFGVVDGLGYLYCNDHAFCAKGTPSPVYGFPHSEEPCDSCGVGLDATLPAFSSLSEPEIDAALEGVGK